MSPQGTILIIEDQEGFRRIYEDLLTHEGYQVLTAEDGEKGWLLSKEKKPDLVLLDLGLPVIDGFEVLQRMRADETTRAIPVVIFSVMGEQRDITKAMEMGANDYTIKGFYTPRQILSKVKALITHVAPKMEAGPYRVELRLDKGDALRLLTEIGSAKGLQCSQCGEGLTLELFPDAVRSGGHWFSGRLACPKCGKAV